MSDRVRAGLAVVTFSAPNSGFCCFSETLLNGVQKIRPPFDSSLRANIVTYLNDERLIMDDRRSFREKNHPK
jgi:hypothetical protein